MPGETRIFGLTLPELALIAAGTYFLIDYLSKQPSISQAASNLGKETGKAAGGAVANVVAGAADAAVQTAAGSDLSIIGTGTAASALFGAGVGSIVPGFGTAAGAIIGGSVGLVTSTATVYGSRIVSQVDALTKSKQGRGFLGQAIGSIIPGIGPYIGSELEKAI